MKDEELKSLLEPLAVEFFASLLGAEPKTKSSEKYYPPEAAKNNAKKVLRWREEYGSEVKGMTQVGWVRARQLASGKGVSLDVVKRMARFNRHRKNAEVAPEYKETPWKDAGYVAWLGWGGTTGIEWAMRISSQQKEVDCDVIEKSGSTTEGVDSLGRPYRYVNGVRVPVSDGEGSKPDKDTSDDAHSAWREREAKRDARFAEIDGTFVANVDEKHAKEYEQAENKFLSVAESPISLETTTQEMDKFKEEFTANLKRISDKFENSSIPDEDKKEVKNALKSELKNLESSASKTKKKLESVKSKLQAVQDKLDKIGEFVPEDLPIEPEEVPHPGKYPEPPAKPSESSYGKEPKINDYDPNKYKSEEDRQSAFESDYDDWKEKRDKIDSDYESAYRDYTDAVDGYRSDLESYRDYVTEYDKWLEDKKVVVSRNRKEEDKHNAMVESLNRKLETISQTDVFGGFQDALSQSESNFDEVISGVINRFSELLSAESESDPEPKRAEKDVQDVVTKQSDEANTPGQPLSCVMLNVSDELKALQSLLVSHLSKDDLAAKGVEDEPHITIRFGLHTQDAEPMIGFANLIQPIRFTVNGFASFASKEYDVLFLTVDSPELVRFNGLLGKLPNTQTHPKYVPHLTLAYVKPGTASACIAKLPKFDPVESVSNSFVFSNADKKQTTFILGATPETPTVKVSMKTSDECPVCGKKAKGRCRCMIGNQFCENGHDWHTCKVHGVVLGTGHGVRKPNGCTCGGADAD